MAKPNPNTSPAADSPEPTAAAPSASGAAGGEQANPQEQASYEKVVLAGVRILDDPATHQKIMAMLAHGKTDPAQALSAVAILIIQQLDQQAQKANRSNIGIPRVVALPAAMAILGLAAELAQAAQLFQVDAHTAARATQQTVLALAQYFGGRQSSLQSLIKSVPQDQLQTIVKQQSSFGAKPAATPAAPAAAGVAGGNP